MEQKAKLTHPYAYIEGAPGKPITAEDEDKRLRENNIDTDNLKYFSFSTGDELILIKGYTKKKTNRKTGKPIKVRAFFKQKDKAEKGSKTIKEYKEDGHSITSGESMLHELAKSCFDIHRQFSIKGLNTENKLWKYTSESVNKYDKLLDNAIVDIESVETEKTLRLVNDEGDKVFRRPDITLKCYELNSDSYFDIHIEIAVKHKKSEEDIRLFRMNKLNVIEINLNSLIELVDNIGEAEDSIPPNKFLNTLYLNVLHSIYNQTWLSNSLQIDYKDRQDKIKEYTIEKCGYRDRGQKGMLNFKCSCSPGTGRRTITNLDCAKCKNLVCTSGDMEYIYNDNKYTCDSQPVLLCCKEEGIINKETKEFNFKRGYENL